MCVCVCVCARAGDPRVHSDTLHTQPAAAIHRGSHRASPRAAPPRRDLILCINDEMHEEMGEGGASPGTGAAHTHQINIHNAPGARPVMKVTGRSEKTDNKPVQMTLFQDYQVTLSK